MTYEQFKPLYELQLTLGACIDHLMKCEYNSKDFTTTVIKEADALGKRLKNIDAHWMDQPPSTTLAYHVYNQKGQ